MEKRVNRNQELYKQVNEQIKAKVQKNSNDEFKHTQNTLKSINPQLFGKHEDDQKVIEESKEGKLDKKKIVTTALIFIGILILIIVIAVVISLWQKGN